MGLKIIGVGFGRTGTASLYTALNELGFPCYHMFEVLQNKQNKSHLGFWLKVANSPPGVQHDWDQVFSKYTAAVDNPACVVWRELMAAYPDAKVVLTTHPKGAETWFESTIDTIYFSQSMWQMKVLAALTPFGHKMVTMTRKLIWERGHRNSMPDRQKAIAFYKQHIEEVRAAVPPERLLEYTVTQGWAPLCRFLGVPAPATPFPSINDRAEFQKIKAGMARIAYVVLGLGTALTAGLAYGLARIFS